MAQHIGYYRIDPVNVEGYAAADGVWLNTDGAWLGEWDTSGPEPTVQPYTDEGGDYLSAPANWRDHIIE